MTRNASADSSDGSPHCVEPSLERQQQDQRHAAAQELRRRQPGHVERRFAQRHAAHRQAGGRPAQRTDHAEREAGHECRPGRHVAGVGQDDCQHAGEADHEPEEPQPADPLGEHDPPQQRDEERRGVEEHRRHRRTRAAGGLADPEQRQRGVAESDQRRDRPQPPGPRQSAPEQRQRQREQDARRRSLAPRRW